MHHGGAIVADERGVLHRRQLSGRPPVGAIHETRVGMHQPAAQSRRAQKRNVVLRRDATPFALGETGRVRRRAALNIAAVAACAQSKRLARMRRHVLHAAAADQANHRHNLGNALIRKRRLSLERRTRHIYARLDAQRLWIARKSEQNMVGQLLVRVLDANGLNAGVKFQGRSGNCSNRLFAHFGIKRRVHAFA